MLGIEQEALREPVRRLHGETVLWVSEFEPGARWLSRCMARQSIAVVSAPQGSYVDAQHSVICSELEKLPFATGSLSAVVLHHSLETVSDPRTAVREVDRVLAPGGRLLVVQINPFSLLGLRKVYARFFSDPLSTRNLVTPLRLFDWLAVLGYELQHKPTYLALGRVFRSTGSGGSDGVQGVVQKSRFRQFCQTATTRLVEKIGARFDSLPVELPFGSLVVIEAVKQRSAGIPPLSRTQSPKVKDLAPVAYPAVSSWQRKQDSLSHIPVE